MMPIKQIPLKYEIKDVDLDVEVSVFPKDPVLRYKFIITNFSDENIFIETIRAKNYLLGIIDIYKGENLNIVAHNKIEIQVERSIKNLFDFGNSFFNYFMKPDKKALYKIRGLVKIEGDLYRIKSIHCP